MNRRITLSQHAQRYLRERRRLGFQLRSMGHALHSFTRYVDRLKPRRPVTLELMAEWARRDRGHSTDPRTWARRLKILRPFTRWLQQFEPRTEVPDDTVFGPVGDRVAPHIFSEQEIAELVRAAGRLRPELRGTTYSTLFALIASTGLRVSEAVHLHNADVDLKVGVLTVRRTKFAKYATYRCTQARSSLCVGIGARATAGLRPRKIVPSLWALEAGAAASS
jgi:site-specific recombinase XerD